MALSYSYKGHWDSALGASNVDTPPIAVNAGDMIVMAVIADSYQDTAFVLSATMTWPDSRTFPYSVVETWYANVNSGALAGVFAYVAPTGGNPGFHASISNPVGPTTRRRPSVEIWTISGVDTSNPVIGTGVLDLWGNPINATLGGAGQSVAIMAGGDGFKLGAPWVSGDGLSWSGAGWGFDQPGITGISGFSMAASWPGGAGNHWLTIDPPGSNPCPYAFASMEFRPAPVAPTVDAGVDRTVERTKGIIRTAGEPSDGGRAITARQWRLQSGPAGSGAPADLPAYQDDPRRVLLPSAVAGVHVVRYTATNAVGPGYDEATITVTALRPSVNAGADATISMGLFTRTATELAGDNAITSRRWYIAAGPAGVGTTIGSAAALSWTPPSLGQWTLGYTATSSAGTSDPDTMTLVVGVTGVPLTLDRTPAPKLAVAIAFAGDLTDPDGSSWVFTEVTTDVRTRDGIHVRHGRADEASVSQPAQCRFVLDNRTGRYSLGGRSPYWPNVRQGTPVQISCDLVGDGAHFQTIFTGYADGWTPSYSVNPLTGERGDATVTLVASGDLRRMQQGQPPVVSPIRRGLLNTPAVVAYWPCEDEATAHQIASAFPGAPPMDYSGRLHGGSNPGLPAASPRLAESSALLCSAPLPLVSDSEWYGTVPDYPGTEIIQLRCLIDVPAPGSNDGGVILGLITTGDPGFWELRYRTGGLINVRAWRNFQSLVLDNPTNGIALVPHPSGSGFVGIDGRRGQLGLTLTKSGGNIDWVVDFIEQGATVGYVWGPGAGAPTVAGTSVGKAQRIQTCTDGGHVDVALGHIVVRSDSYDIPGHVNQLNAHSGESVGARLARLCAEAGIWYTQYDPPPPYYATITDTMGPQPAGTVLDLFRDCETTDQGILWDGVGPGLSYTTKRYRESRPPALTLNAAAGEVGFPFAPLHDDAGRVNRAQASRRGGSSATFADATGPLGYAIVGRYDDTLNPPAGCQGDAALIQYAAWMVGQGTCEGYRYPRLSLDLTAHPEFLDAWLRSLDPNTGTYRAMIPGDRVDVLNLSGVNPAAPVEDVSLLIEGFEQTITPTSWDVIMNTSLAQRWAVASAAAATIGGAGETRPEYVARCDTDASTIAVLTPVGQSTLDVIVSAGPLWTTDAAATTGDYPLYLDIGALRVRATGCTAGGVAGDPHRQTFSIEPMPVTRPAGTVVRLWNPPVYGL